MSPEDVARRLRAELDAVPVPERPWVAVRPALARRRARHRVMEAVAAAAAVVLIAGFGVAAARVSARARRLATGRVTATVSCPQPGTQIAAQGIAATRNRLFFIDCQKIQKAGAKYTVSQSWLYEARLTGSGQISGYSLVPGGVLGPHGLEGIGATLDGSEVAVTLGPSALDESSSPSAPAAVLVINTKTGVRAIWHGGPKVFSAGDFTFTGNGRELEFIGAARCSQAQRFGCEELRAVSPAAAGGQLGSSRLLLRLSALARSPGEYIEPAIITTGGSTLTAVVQRNQTSLSQSLWVVQYSAATGRLLRVLYKLPTGNGFSYGFLSSDPAGRHLLFNAGPASGQVNGWIDHGQLIRLKPVYGNYIAYETW